MNVTITLREELCKAARHRAVDSGQSLSRWIADVVLREVSAPSEKGNLLQALGDESTADKEVEFPRSDEPIKSAEF